MTEELKKEIGEMVNQGVCFSFDTGRFHAKGTLYSWVERIIEDAEKRAKVDEINRIRDILHPLNNIWTVSNYLKERYYELTTHP
jgi:hypothetical protein